MKVDKLTESLWRQHLDVSTPRIKMPSHLNMTHGPKVDNERSVRLVFERLTGMEFEAPRMRTRTRGETPNHLAGL